MRKCLILLLIACLLSGCVSACAAQNTAHLSSVRVDKFRMEIVNGGFWLVQTGEWDAQARPRYLVRSYPDGGEQRVELPAAWPGMEAGTAWRLCDAADLTQDDAEKGSGGLVEYSIQCEENGEWVKLASAYPLLDTAYNSIALIRRIWLADGALWLGGYSDGTAALTIERSSGETETILLPENDSDHAVMIRTPAEIQADLAAPDVAWVRYSLPQG